MEKVNNTHLFSKAHQIGIDFSFLYNDLIMSELKMIFESDEEYDTLLVGKTKEFGSNYDFTVSFGVRLMLSFKIVDSFLTSFSSKRKLKKFCIPSMDMPAPFPYIYMGLNEMEMREDRDDFVTPRGRSSSNERNWIFD